MIDIREVVERGFKECRNNGKHLQLEEMIFHVLNEYHKEVTRVDLTSKHDCISLGGGGGYGISGGNGGFDGVVFHPSGVEFTTDSKVNDENVTVTVFNEEIEK